MSTHSVNPLDFFDKEVTSPLYVDPTVGLVTSDLPNAPTGHELVAFRVAARLPGTDTFKLSVPMNEVLAVDVESALGQLPFDMGAHLRPVWGRPESPDPKTTREGRRRIIAKWNWDRRHIQNAYEASKYFEYVASDESPAPTSGEGQHARIIKMYQLVASLLEKVPCTDYEEYADMCRRTEVPALECQSKWHDERLH